MSALTMGVEEEFLLVDPACGATLPVAEKVVACASAADLPAGATIQRELRDTQAEAATGVCVTAAELRAHLTAGRRVVAAAARDHVAVAVASASPVLESGGRVPSTLARFVAIDDMYGEVTRDYEACGCHVHVGVPDRDTAVAVVNHLARWLPTLLALSVNSPFYQGRDTGYGSWRIVQQSRFPGSGLAPYFRDHTAFRAEVGRLVECGALADEAQTFWFARPSPKLPTVEIRVADTAATVPEAVLHAMLGRALVRVALDDLRRGREAAPVPAQMAAAAVWSAARYGLAGPGVDLERSRRVPATELVTALLDHVRDALTETGDLPGVHAQLDRLRSDGTGAERQRRVAGTGGLPAVVTDLTLRDESDAPGYSEAAQASEEPHG
ncbi:glutamate--cysteine ligase [Plantactinospora sp. BB1]|uniref:carboxylate-amine ligase n=1 Tax=Plantactinospora sp. BB1 TaxID=2071627 RepID=UPI000D163D52|nr:glutamate--cysteine ligase [Plantactinospora sp. BB1]AVT35536.1 carboxylate--amine ligase [Plantactinospora sp. BB1]